MLCLLLNSFSSPSCQFTTFPKLHSLSPLSLRYTISIPIFEQGNPSPTEKMQQYTFKLHEHPNFGWSPRLSPSQLNELLSDIVEIRIRATYSKEGVGVIDDVELESAAHREGEKLVTHVEKCDCPKVVLLVKAYICNELKQPLK